MALRVLIALLIATASCVDVSWKEGIACNPTGGCPDSLVCCQGRCFRTCALADGASDGRNDDFRGDVATPELPARDAGRRDTASDEGPSIVITDPVNDQTVRAGTTLRLRAMIYDPDGVAIAEMIWDSVPPVTTDLNNFGGGVWGRNLNVATNARTGSRTLMVAAEDRRGNRSTATVTITIMQ